MKPTKYDQGDRVVLLAPMSDEPAGARPIPVGTAGTVRYVDDAGTVHVNWDDGATLGLIPGVDQWRRE